MPIDSDGVMEAESMTSVPISLVTAHAEHSRSGRSVLLAVDMSLTVVGSLLHVG